MLGLYFKSNFGIQHCLVAAIARFPYAGWPGCFINVRPCEELSLSMSVGFWLLLIIILLALSLPT